MSGRNAMLAIPQAIRDAVDLRDGGFCRVCGAWPGDARHHHHVNFGGDRVGMGGRRFHHVDNLVTLCLGCHDLVHSAKLVWIPWLELAIRTPGVTAFQLRRRHARRQRSLSYGVDRAAPRLIEAHQARAG